jgi:hypothetical protein
MYRIDNSTALTSLPVAQPPLTPGYFTDGNPASGLPATIVDAWWCNMLQEEILTVISAAGIVPDKNSHRQLYDALQTLYTQLGQEGAFLPLAGGTLTGELIIHHGVVPAPQQPLLTFLHSGFSITSAGKWRIVIANNTGNLAFHTNTAPAGDFSSVVTPLQLTPWGSVNIVADLLLSDTANAVRYVLRPNVTGYKNLAFAVEGAGPLDLCQVNSVRTDLLGSVGITQFLQVTGNITTGGGGHIEGGGWINAAYGMTVGTGDLVLNRRDTATQAIVRPNVAGFKNIDFGAGATDTGLTPLDVLNIRALYTQCSNELTVAGTTTTWSLTVSADSRLNGQLQVSGETRCYSAVYLSAINVLTGSAIYVSPGTAGMRVSGNFLTVSGTNGCTDGVNGWGQYSQNGFLYFGVTDANGALTNELICAMTEDLTGSVGFQVTAAGGNAWKPNGGEWAALGSSREIKKDIENYERGLAAVLALRPVTFKFNGEGPFADAGVTYHGLIAEEVVEVMPEMVEQKMICLSGDDPEPKQTWTMDRTPMSFALVNAVKELAARVEALEAKAAPAHR